MQIVVLLEVIDIGHQQRERRAHPQIAAPFDDERLVEATAVGNRRQTVDLAQLREMCLSLSELQVRQDSRAGNAQVDRFGNVVDGTELQSMRLAFFVADARHEDDGNVARGFLLLQQPANLVAIDPRHHHVEENQVGRFLIRCDRERAFAVGGDADAEIVAKAVDQQLQVDRLIVRDQQQRPPRLRLGHDLYTLAVFAGFSTGTAPFSRPGRSSTCPRAASVVVGAQPLRSGRPTWLS